jgi:hypothetical protein
MYSIYEKSYNHCADTPSGVQTPLVNVM